ncbi:MAG: CoA transferase [Acidimicrobiales bacterium]
MLALRGLDLALELMTQDGHTAQSPFKKHIGGEPPSRQNPGNPLWNTYRCADGKWIALAMVQSDPHWSILLDALGNPRALHQRSPLCRPPHPLPERPSLRGAARRAVAFCSGSSTEAVASVGLSRARAQVVRSGRCRRSCCRWRAFVAPRTTPRP